MTITAEQHERHLAEADELAGKIHDLGQIADPTDDDLIALKAATDQLRNLRERLIPRYEEARDEAQAMFGGDAATRQAKILAETGVDATAAKPDGYYLNRQHRIEMAQAEAAEKAARAAQLAADAAAAQAEADAKAAEAAAIPDEVAANNAKRQAERDAAAAAAEARRAAREAAETP